MYDVHLKTNLSVPLFATLLALRLRLRVQRIPRFASTRTPRWLFRCRKYSAWKHPMRLAWKEPRKRSHRTISPTPGRQLCAWNFHLRHPVSQINESWTLTTRTTLRTQSRNSKLSLTKTTLVIGSLPGGHYGHDTPKRDVRVMPE